MVENTKKRSGRPRKAEHEKVQYQRIAVYAQDYSSLVDKINRRNKNKPQKERTQITDAFTDMVQSY